MISCTTLSDRKPKLSIVAFDFQHIFIPKTELGVFQTSTNTSSSPEVTLRLRETCNNLSPDCTHRNKTYILLNFISTTLRKKNPYEIKSTLLMHTGISQQNLLLSRVPDYLPASSNTKGLN